MVDNCNVLSRGQAPDGVVKSAQAVEFPATLRRQIARKPPVIWNGAANQRSRIVRAWLDLPSGQVIVAALPPYPPEVNPVEAIRACVKKHGIDTVCSSDIDPTGDSRAGSCGPCNGPDADSRLLAADRTGALTCQACAGHPIGTMPRPANGHIRNPKRR